MIVKVSDVMRHVRNHFIRDGISGTWQHTAGVLTPSEDLSPGMWIAVTGEDGNVPIGVFQLDEMGGIHGLEDTEWTGTVYRLNPPADFLRLCGDIACWAAANPDPAATGEKLGQYSLSRQTMDWQTAFAAALAPYRRMYAEVTV